MAHKRKYFGGTHDGRVEGFEEDEADDRFIALNRDIYIRMGHMTTQTTTCADTTAIYCYLKSVPSSEVLDTLRALEDEAEEWEEE